MDSACRALATTTAPIAAIAELVGCGDVTYLSRRFRRRFGCTPRQWRQQLPGQES